MHKSKLTAILYLENNLISRAFTSKRIEVLDILASQIAISIENARLYGNLKEAEEKYRAIFENAVEGIYQTTLEGRFISVNPAMARLFGFDSAEELMESTSDIAQQLHGSVQNKLIIVLHKLKELEKIPGHRHRFYRMNQLSFIYPFPRAT
jgi:PAS domain S-box-containing protein